MPERLRRSDASEIADLGSAQSAIDKALAMMTAITHYIPVSVITGKDLLPSITP